MFLALARDFCPLKLVELLRELLALVRRIAYLEGLLVAHGLSIYVALNTDSPRLQDLLEGLA